MPSRYRRIQSRLRIGLRDILRFRGLRSFLLPYCLASEGFLDKFYKTVSEKLGFVSSRLDSLEPLLYLYLLSWLRFRDGLKDTPSDIGSLLTAS